MSKDHKKYSGGTDEQLMRLRQMFSVHRNENLRRLQGLWSNVAFALYNNPGNDLSGSYVTKQPLNGVDVYVLRGPFAKRRKEVVLLRDNSRNDSLIALKGDFTNFHFNLIQFDLRVDQPNDFKGLCQAADDITGRVCEVIYPLSQLSNLVEGCTGNSDREKALHGLFARTSSEDICEKFLIPLGVSVPSELVCNEEHPIASYRLAV